MIEPIGVPSTLPPVMATLANELAPLLVTLPVKSPVTLPVKLLVIIPALKLPLASRATTVLGVF